MRRGVKIILSILTIFLVVALLLVGPIDRTPLTELSSYQEMSEQLDTLQLIPSKKSTIAAGWTKISITPAYNMPMAGYRMRNHFESIHDSLYARIIVLHIDKQPVYLISVDLLLFPPSLKEKLNQQFNTKAITPFLYLSATHTHNGIGGWHDTPVGNVVLGKYNAQWVNETANKITQAIKILETNLKQSSLSYWQADAREYAENRLVDGAPHDGKLRGIKLTREDSTSAQLITFSAHATSISKLNYSLSGDYPAALVDSLTNSSNFAMFMAGMVGSHRLAGINETEFELVAKAGGVLSKKIESASYEREYDSITFLAKQIPIEFAPSQLRIATNWKLRDWVFRWLLDPLQGEITYLQLNDIVFIGTPCDFSGEVYVNHIAEVAARHNKKVIITSFNGDYAGYITEDAHYETLQKEEVMTLNWVGPHNGIYFAEMINKLLSK